MLTLHRDIKSENAERDQALVSSLLQHPDILGYWKAKNENHPERASQFEADIESKYLIKGLNQHRRLIESQTPEQAKVGVLRGIHYSTISGNVKTLRSFMQLGFTFTADQKRDILHDAVRYGQPEILSALCSDFQFDIKTPNSKNKTAWYTLVETPPDRVLGMARTLQSLGLDSLSESSDIFTYLENNAHERLAYLKNIYETNIDPDKAIPVKIRTSSDYSTYYFDAYMNALYARRYQEAECIKTEYESLTDSEREMCQEKWDSHVGAHWARIALNKNKTSIVDYLLNNNIIKPDDLPDPGCYAPTETSNPRAVVAYLCDKKGLNVNEDFNFLKPSQKMLIAAMGIYG